MIAILHEPGEVELLLHIRSSTAPAKFVVRSNTVLESSNHQRVSVSDFSYKDQVIAIGLPSPDRALSFDATRIIDSNLAPITEQATVSQR